VTDTTVTRFPGVYRRTDSAVWTFALKAPKDLLHRFEGKPWAVRCSLETKDVAAAKELAKALHAKWSQRFAAMRLEDNPQTVTLSPALVASVVAEVRRWVLEADDNMRGFPGGPQALVAREERRRLLAEVAASPVVVVLPLSPDLSALTIGKAAAGPPPAQKAPALDPLAGLTDAQAGALAQFNAGGAAAASVDMARRNLKEVHALAAAVSKSLGWQAEWTTTEGAAGLLEVLKAYRTARADLVRKDAGEVVDTPKQQPQQCPQGVAETPPADAPGRRMGDALTAWLALGVRKPKTISVFTRHVGQFKVMTGDPLLSAIDKAGASKFRADLQRWAVEHGKTRETADNVLASIKALANVAVGDGWMVSNPFAGLAVTEGGKEAEQREPWTPEELPALFASPVFGTYSVPPGDTAAERKAGLDAAYWVPLLCLYSGARPGEVCQLWTDDLSEVNDSEGAPVLVVEFRPNKDRGQSLKNPASWRSLPIHSELLRLGFREYWQAIGQAQDGKPGPLFPAIPTKGDNGPGGQFGQWFGKFKEAQGFSTTKTLHSFRHTAETELAFAEVSPTMVDAITGHEGQGIGRKQYGATIRRNAVRLRPSLERLQFPGLNLPRVYKAPAWKP
jgi:integrase